jgi:phosphoserine phosphatase
LRFFMDMAQLNTDLQQASERLLEALTHEREARSGNRTGTWMTSQYRLRAARRDVERSVESYALALRSYRVAILAEFAPPETVQSGILERICAHRERTRVTLTASGSGWHTCCPKRKEGTGEAFPRIDTKL